MPELWHEGSGRALGTLLLGLLPALSLDITEPSPHAPPVTTTSDHALGITRRLPAGKVGQLGNYAPVSNPHTFTPGVLRVPA